MVTEGNIDGSYVVKYSDYLREKRITDTERIKCASFLDSHSSIIYSFDIKGQSELYHKRLLEDISPDGQLRNIIDPNGNKSEQFDQLIDIFSSCQGSRRTFIDIASKTLNGFNEELSHWAALRYYTTPAELQPRCLRDFPVAISNELRKCGLSRPLSFVDPDEFGAMPEPMSSAHRVLISLPRYLTQIELQVLSSIVLDIRRQVPKGSAKYASLCEKGFQDNIQEINQLFSEALAREKSFSLITCSQIADMIAGNAPSLLISWTLGVSFGPLLGAGFDLIQNLIRSIVANSIKKNTQPFLETAEKLSVKTRKLHSTL